MNASPWKPGHEAILLGAIVVAAGCGTGGEPSHAPAAPGPASAKGIVATIDGRNWLTVAGSPTAPAFFAAPGGMNPNELTIIGFGTFEAGGDPNRPDRVTIFLPDVEGPTTVSLGAIALGVYTTTTEPLAHYVTDATHAGEVTITRYDRAEGLVSGTFSFTGASGESTLTVAGGRFVDVPLLARAVSAP